ncbi:hypothetical protein DUI87_01517 [Hirundo rustica rustica]|uniref:Uncharacterized protein n=1 Tax=Hirundo rustica rustica TaxID=333673 RepID=A0A3M0L5J4_HIRRU|nr:hypothetical protein DUI87_01517 [Hirundo rustica rustica]
MAEELAPVLVEEGAQPVGTEPLIVVLAEGQMEEFDNQDAMAGPNRALKITENGIKPAYGKREDSINALQAKHVVNV